MTNFSPKETEEKTCSTINKQTRLMIWKNYLVFRRNLKITGFQIAVPILICIILVLLNALVKMYSDDVIIIDPPINDLVQVERCLYPSDCITIGYALTIVIYIF